MDDITSKSIAEQIKEAAEGAVQSSGFVYEETSGMYYDCNTGYYYNPVRFKQLFDKQTCLTRVTFAGVWVIL